MRLLAGWERVGCGIGAGVDGRGRAGAEAGRGGDMVREGKEGGKEGHLQHRIDVALEDVVVLEPHQVDDPGPEVVGSPVWTQQCRTLANQHEPSSSVT